MAVRVVFFALFVWVLSGFALAASETARIGDLGGGRVAPSAPPCIVNTADNAPGGLSTSGRRQERAPSCLVRAEWAIEGLAKKRLTIVDTRPSSEFARFQIPGSLNISAHAVKTKAFLKSQPLVLVNADHSTAELETVCADLKRNGFSKPVVLKGGLFSWEARGGALEGDLISARALNLVEPAELLLQPTLSEWVVIDISGRKNPEMKAVFPDRVTIARLHDHIPEKVLFGAVEKAGKKRVLIVDEMGDGYALAQNILGSQRSDVLYLKGGFQAYLKLRREQVAMWKQRDNPPKRKGCSA